MPRGSYVVDDNNIPQAILAIQSGLDDGMEELHEDVLNAVLTNWDAGADATGAPWPPLSNETVERKGFGDILVESGELQANVESTSRYDKSNRASIISSSLPYAGVHEFGLPEQGIPARPFLSPAAKYAQQNWDEFIDKKIDRRLNAARVGRGGL